MRRRRRPARRRGGGGGGGARRRILGIVLGIGSVIAVSPAGPPLAETTQSLTYLLLLAHALLARRSVRASGRTGDP